MPGIPELMRHFTGKLVVLLHQNITSMKSEARMNERQVLIEKIRAYDSFYITHNFELYSLEDLYLLRDHIEKTLS